jgi:hypothetical protein
MTIAGDWYNEYGSHMRLATDPSGGITGTYISAAGHASGRYVLVGRYDTPAGADYSTALGWTVAWRNEDNNADSVTSWNGLYQGDGEERILATWLLTRSATAPNVWEATAVGQDVFTRDSPSPRQIEHQLRLGKPTPHPRGAAPGRPG